MNAMTAEKPGFDTLPLVLIMTAVSVVVCLLSIDHHLFWGGVVGLIGLILSTRWLITQPGGQYGWWPKIIVVGVCVMITFTTTLAGFCDLVQWVGMV